MSVARPVIRARIAAALQRSRGVVLVGPRQVGKTTLARGFVAAGDANYFDLEDPRVEALFDSPMLLLERLRGLVVIDEVQRAPELFKALRVLMDRDAAPAKFLLLGSASPGLLRQSSESLAGRVEVIEIGGFTLDESCAAVFHAPTSQPPTPTAGAGGRRSPARSSSATCRSWGSTSPPPPCAASGPCSRT
jgi:uncharacterized protein